MPLTPGRTTVKRRRTRGTFVSAPLHNSLPTANTIDQRINQSKINSLPKGDHLAPSYPSLFASDDDSLRISLPTASQRADLPDMSQDTLALFPTIVQEHHLLNRTTPNDDSSPIFIPASSDVIPTDYPANAVRRSDSTRRSLARASLISTLSGARSMENPFLNPVTPPRPPPEITTPHTAKDQFPIIKKIANASESFQNMTPVLELDDTFLLTGDPRKSSGNARQSNRKRLRSEEDHEKHDILKVLLVSSTQGRKFSIDFEQVRVAGKGAFSEVLQARHHLDGCTYAIKKNITPLMSDKARLDSLQEVFALSALQGHPNILRYHDAWFEEKGKYLHMQTEFLSEGSLYALFVEQQRRMPLHELIALASDLSSALAFMHTKGIAHLDVKPDNIFRSNRGLTRKSFIIGDFGLACHRDGTDARSTEGDSRYLCPEAMDSSTKYANTTAGDSEDEDTSDDDELSRGSGKSTALSDLRARDVFSLGATLYELATGVPLQKSGEEWRRFRSDTALAAKEAGSVSGSSEIANIVRRCLEPDPAQRALASEIFDICNAHSSPEASSYVENMRKEVETLRRQLLRYEKATKSLLNNGELNRQRYREKCAEYANRAKQMPSRCREQVAEP